MNSRIVHGCMYVVIYGFVWVCVCGCIYMFTLLNACVCVYVIVHGCVKLYAWMCEQI